MLMFAKFVPGLATLAASGGRRKTAWASPLSCSSTASAPRCGSARCSPSAASSATLLKRDPSLLNWVGRFSGALLILGIVGFFIGRLFRRRMVLKKLAASRLEPEELKRQLDAGEPVYIVDLRHPLELLPDPFTLPGALHFSPDALATRHLEIPRDRDVVLYCTCPSEATAAKTAMTLHKLGIERVRPLRGGFDEWKRLGYPAGRNSAGHADWFPSSNRLNNHLTPTSQTSAAMLFQSAIRSRCMGRAPAAAL